VRLLSLVWAACNDVTVDAFVGTLAGVAVGGIATYATQRAADNRRQTSEAIRAIAELYDRAIAAVAEVQSSRWGPGLKVAAGTFPAIGPEKMESTIERLETETLKRFLGAKLAARAGLAALEPFSGDLKRFWDKDEVAAQDDFNELMSLLAERRKQLFGRKVRTVSVVQRGRRPD
jgi:hypothetical protein